ncbi:hypothetical protein OKW41_003677 [Paraburkholderia sp. UCT70]
MPEIRIRGAARCRVNAMNVKRLTVYASPGSLRVVEVWKSLIEHRAQVCGWSAHVNNAGGRESLSVDLVDCPADRLAIISAALSSGPMTVLATDTESTIRSS